MNKFKSLGDISLEDKKVIWRDQLSGSQIKDLITNPLELYGVKKGHIEKPDLNSIPGLANRLAMGNYMEPIIIKAYEEFHNLEVKTTKETFQSESDEFLTANIDGYIGEDINNIDYIVEVKNTKVQNVDELIARYLPQLDYYMMFFNVNIGGKFFFFTDGWDTKLVTIERSLEREASLQITIETFKEQLATNTPPNEFGEEEAIKINGLESKVERFQEVKGLIKTLKKEESEIKTIIDTEFDGNLGIAEGINYQVKRIAINKKGTTNYKAIAYELAEKHSEDILMLEERHTTNGSVNYQLRVSRFK